MRSSNELVYTAGNSIASSSSNSLLSEQWVRTSFQIACTAGGINGTFSVQGSNDIAVGVPPNQFIPTNWNNIGSSQSVVCSFSVGTCALIPWFDTCYKYHRLIYAAVGGTAGSFSARAEVRAL